MYRPIVNSSRDERSGIPAEVLPHLLRHFCFESQQSPKQAQRAVCALLCTSRSVRAAAARHCQGLLHIRLHAKRSSRRALQFAGWLRRHMAVVKELHLDLPQYSKEVERAIATALAPAADAGAAGWLRKHKALVKELPPDLAQYGESLEREIAAAQTTAADASASGAEAEPAATCSSGAQCQIQLQSYVCHTRSTSHSFILQALPTHSLTQLSLLFEEELDEVEEILNVVTIPALAGLSKLQCLELHTSKGYDLDPVVPAVAALTALTRLHLHWLDNLRQLQHAPPQLLELGFYLQYGLRRPHTLNLSHLTRLTSLGSGSHLGIRLRAGDILPASLQQMTVSDCDSVEPLVPLRQLRRLCVDNAKATLAQEIAALRCRLSGVSSSAAGAYAGVSAGGRGSGRVTRSRSRSTASISSSNGSMPERCLPNLAELQLCGCDSYKSRPVVTPEVVEAWLALQPALQCLEIDAVPSEVAELVLQQLPKLQGLTQLELRHCDSFAATPAELGAAVGKLTGLQELHLHRFHSAQEYLYTDEVMPLTAAIAGLSGLRSLSISAMQLNLPELRALQPCLTQLTSLALRDCGLNDVMTGDVLYGLAGQQQLQSGRVTSSTSSRSKAACLALVQLELTDNSQVSDAVLPVLAKLVPGLTYLDLMSTGVTDRGMRFLQALTRLEQLELDGTSVCLQEKMRALRQPVELQPWEVQRQDADDVMFV